MHAATTRPTLGARSTARQDAFETQGGSFRFETPEGIDLVVSPAGPVARGLAIVIDTTITQVGSIAALIALAFLGEAGLGVYLVLAFLVEWFYPVLFEVLRGGQTPGKRAMKLRVVNADATPISWNASLLRNLLRVVDLLPGLYLVGFFSTCLTRRFQRLGDLAADTLVIHATAETDVAGAELIAPGDLARLGAQPSPLPLTSEEQRALLAYAERQGRLSAERSIELAEVLEPLTGGRGERGRRILLEIANGLVGEGLGEASEAANGRAGLAGARATAASSEEVA